MADNEHLDKLQDGLNILIEVKSGLFRGNYLSNISKVIKNQELYIEIPKDKEGKEVGFWPKTLLFMSFFRENEPGAIYEFSEPIVRVEQGVRNTIVINFPKEIERIQRRSYVRVDIRMPFRWQKISPEDNETVSPVVKEGFIMDISGGGVFLRTCEKMEKDQLVMTNFQLNEEEFDVKARIVRVIPKQRGKSFMYKYGVLFEDMMDMVRRKVIGYVFEVERNNIRKQKEAYS